MKGSCIIIHTEGWAITNESVLDEDKIFDPDKKILTGVLTLKNFHIFDSVGRVSDEQAVECLFKSDSGRKELFIGTVKARRGKLTIIENLTRSDNYTQTLNKIRK